MSDTNRTKLLTKTLTLLLTLSLTLTLLLTLLLTPYSADAKSSSEYEKYKKISLGMTVTQVAKIIYGSTYKSHLKVEKGVVTLKKTPRMKSLQKTYSYYDFEFYGIQDKRTTEMKYQLFVVLKTKPKTKTLHVVEKSFDNLDVSHKKFYYGQKPKVGMSVKQLDSILEGSGLGAWSYHAMQDYSKIGEPEATGDKLTFPPRLTWITYTFKSHSGKTEYTVFLEYNYKKKNYYVSDII